MIFSNRLPLLSTGVACLLFGTALGAEINGQTITQSPALQKLVDGAVQQAVSKFADKKLTTNQIAVTLIDLKNPDKLLEGSYRGGEPIYPASVVKLFYLVAVHRWLEDGKLKDSEELRRGMHDMIVDSHNEATGYIVDSLTETTSGPELSPAELEKWYERRNVVNRYFVSLGYTNINVNRKPWSEGPYGREMQSVKAHAPNHRNLLTTDATARLLAEIATGRAVSTNRCAQMLELLSRDPFNKRTSLNGQARGFTGLALPPGSKLWSKAGWTSDTRHDAAYVMLPDGRRFVLVTFTTDHPTEKEIIATVARNVIAGLEADK